MVDLLKRNRVIVLLAATLYGSLGGFPSLWSVFQADAAQLYGITLAESAMMLPMCTAFWGIFYIIGGMAMKKFAPRTVALMGMIPLGLAVIGLSLHGNGTSVTALYFLFSLPFGGGCGFASRAFMPWLYQWYADKNGFAAGAMAAMSSIILMCETYLARFALTAFGMRGATRLFGVVFTIIGVAISLLMVNPDEKYVAEKSAIAALNRAGNGKKKETAVSQNLAPKEMLKTPQYYMLFFMAMFALPAYQLLASSIVTLGISRGLPERTAVSMVAVSMGVSAIGKFIVPTISDKVGRKKCLVVFEGLILVASVLLMITSGMPLFFAYNMLVFVHGSASTLILPFGNDMFGLKYSAQNSGYISVYSTIASLLTPVLLGIVTPFAGANVNHIIAIAGSALAFALAVMINPHVKAKRE